MTESTLIRRIQRSAIVLLLVAFLMGAFALPSGAVRPAWQGITDPLDLAALALRPGDVSEPGWKHAGAFFEDLSSQAQVAAGYRGDDSTVEDVAEQLVAFEWECMYINAIDGPTTAGSAPTRRIHSYITEYGTAEGAVQGFAFLEDEGSIASAEDVPGTRSFGDQSELTSDEGTTEVDGQHYQSLDLTFREGALVAGVTVISYGEGAAEPTVAETEALAEVLDARLQAELEGSGLGAKIVRFGPDANDVTTYDDAYYRIGGEDVPLVDESLSAASRRIASYADADDVYQLWQGIDVGDPDGVLFGVTALHFKNQSAAEAWLEALPDVLGDNPFYAGLRPVDLPADQKYSAIGLSYVSGGGSPDAPRSVLVAVRVGAVVARVHVVPQGISTDVSPDDVLFLAAAEASCINGDGCDDLADMPVGDNAGQPVASPTALRKRDNWSNASF